MENNTSKKLYRSNKNKMIGGVCGGVGEYFNIDPTLVRLAFVLLGLCAGGLIAYIAALIIVPEGTCEEPATAESNTAQAEAAPSADDSSTDQAEKTTSPNENSPTML